MAKTSERSGAHNQDQVHSASPTMETNKKIKLSILEVMQKS